MYTYLTIFLASRVNYCGRGVATHVPAPFPFPGVIMPRLIFFVCFAKY